MDRRNAAQEELVEHVLYACTQTLHGLTVSECRQAFRDLGDEINIDLAHTLDNLYMKHKDRIANPEQFGMLVVWNGIQTIAAIRDAKKGAPDA